ncbi:hypothetical protein HKCCE2091_19745 [Rhodobacterales bacterium HKCCE2091]|nr:hypothetical protein [Rhodobacterales bacterium HKCCE2091]
MKPLRLPLAFCLAMSAQATPAQEVGAALDFLCERTLHFHDPAHGNQVEYFRPDGISFLWYPNEPEIIPGEWRLEVTGPGAMDICFRYPEDSWNPVTGEYGGDWECTAFDNFLAHIVEGGIVEGDPLALSSGDIPAPLAPHPPIDLPALAAGRGERGPSTNCLALVS